jgi:uncharacterized lipoprotein YmbA
VLNSPTESTLLTKQSAKNVDKDQSKISVTLLALPEYLAQPNLVLQLSNHQLHYSNFHMWAEPLNIGLTQALTDDLNSNNKQFSFFVDSKVNADNKADIIVSITAFQATHQSQVILTGHYILNREGLSSEKVTNNKMHSFAFTIELNDNGYLHAVEKMREITSHLAQEISSNFVE